MAGFTSTGFSKIFGCPGIALAFYSTAKKEKKKKILGLLIPITLTAIFCGVTEPIEFTFLFVAPVLYVVYSVLSALLAWSCTDSCYWNFGQGIPNIIFLNLIPLFKNHEMMYVWMLVIGLPLPRFTTLYSNS